MCLTHSWLTIARTFCIFVFWAFWRGRGVFLVGGFCVGGFFFFFLHKIIEAAVVIMAKTCFMVDASNESQQRAYFFQVKLCLDGLHIRF